MSFEIDCKGLPIETFLLTSPIEPLHEQSLCLNFKLRYVSEVSTHTIVLKMTAQLGSHSFPNIYDEIHVP